MASKRKKRKRKSKKRAKERYDIGDTTTMFYYLKKNLPIQPIQTPPTNPPHRVMKCKVLAVRTPIATPTFSKWPTYLGIAAERIALNT